MNDVISAEPGVTNMGFVQPSKQPEIFASHGVFILPSRYDPWPLVIVEACASGLPVVHTEACGSAVELVRPYFNGVSVTTDDAASLARDALVSRPSRVPPRNGPPRPAPRLRLFRAGVDDALDDDVRRTP